jgi:hypothetical protein
MLAARRTVDAQRAGRSQRMGKTNAAKKKTNA